MHCASDLRFVCSSDSRSTAIYTLSLHDALPISVRSAVRCHAATVARAGPELGERRRTLNEEGLRAHQRPGAAELRSEEHTSELQSRGHLVCRLLLEKKKITNRTLTDLAEPLRSR